MNFDVKDLTSFKYIKYFSFRIHSLKFFVRQTGQCISMYCRLNNFSYIFNLIYNTVKLNLKKIIGMFFIRNARSLCKTFNVNTNFFNCFFKPFSVNVKSQLITIFNKKKDEATSYSYIPNIIFFYIQVERKKQSWCIQFNISGSFNIYIFNTLKHNITQKCSF